MSWANYVSKVISRAYNEEVFFNLGMTPALYSSDAICLTQSMSFSVVFEKMKMLLRKTRGNWRLTVARMTSIVFWNVLGVFLKSKRHTYKTVKALVGCNAV